jgi:diguanylate cyclase (GGDEF)-like protein
VYVSVRYLWQVAVLAGTAAVSTQLVHQGRTETAARQSLMVLDETTGLYSRVYFLRALAAEIRRAERDGRPVHVLLIDIDQFGEFNRRFGIELGDKMLQAIAATVTRCVAEAGDIMVTTNLAARFGGEEFAVLLAEDAQTEGPPSTSDAGHLAERLRSAIGSTIVDGASVSVSVGIASTPTDGSTADELLDAADNALSSAERSGGNTVVTAQSLTPAYAGDDYDDYGAEFEDDGDAALLDVADPAEL